MINAITYVLENDSTVQSLVGLNSTSGKHKVYPVVVPESEKSPYIAVRVANQLPQAKGCDSFEWSIQVTCYHKNYDDVAVLNKAIVDALENVARGTVNGVAVSDIWMTDSNDSFDISHNLYAKTTTFGAIGDNGLNPS